MPSVNQAHLNPKISSSRRAASTHLPDGLDSIKHRYFQVVFALTLFFANVWASFTHDFYLVKAIMGTFLPTSAVPLLTTRFVNVLHWAAELHDQQVRETHNIPYISHLLSVSALTIEKGTTLLAGHQVEDAAIVALMHHSVGDVGLPLELFASIGGTVQTAMQLLCETGPDAQPKRRQHYIQQLTSGRGEAAAIAHLVAAADHLDNLRFYAEPGRSVWKPEYQTFYQQFLEQVSVPPAWADEMHGLLERLQQPVRAELRAGVR